MKDIFENYIQSVASKFSHEETSEMGYRADFENLLKGIFATLNIKRIDHDARSKDGNKPDFENREDYIEIALFQNYDVEIDVWFKNNKLYLGHDKSIYLTSLDFLNKHKDKLWIHCKNIEALHYLNEYDYNIFFHNSDDAVLTSKNYIWTYPNKSLGFNNKINKSICVLPELAEYKEFNCAGICSNFILKYKNKNI